LRPDRIVDGWSTGLSVPALIAVAGLSGRWLGRRLPISWAHRGPLTDIGSAVVAPLVLGALFLVVDRLARPAAVTLRRPSRSADRPPSTCDRRPPSPPPDRGWRPPRAARNTVR